MPIAKNTENPYDPAGRPVLLRSFAMSTLALVLALTQHRPLHADDATMQELFRSCTLPLLRALLNVEDVKLALHFTGPMLDWMERQQPRAMELLSGLVARGQVEMLGGPWGNAWLAGLPERDGTGQLRMHAEQVLRQLGVRPRGAVLPEGVWDPELPALLASAELRYTFLDDRLLSPGAHPTGSEGYYLCDHTGHGVRVLPALGLVSNLLANPVITPLGRNLAKRLKAGAEAVVLVESLDHIARELGAAQMTGWVRGLFELLVSQAHWLRTDHPGSRLAKMPRLGRIYPASWVPPRVARWMLNPEEARRLTAYERAVADKPELRHGPPFPRSTSWRATLGRYDEANRLHKRLLLASNTVFRLRRAVESGLGGPRLVQTRLPVLQEAEKLLYAAQSNEVLWHGPDGGVYNAEARHRAWANLASAERLVGRTLEDDTGVRFQVGDHDADGNEEVVVRNPYISAMFDPEGGGALTELLLTDLPGNVLNTMSRREERMHAALDRFSTAPALVSENEEDAPTDPGVAVNADDEDSLTILPPSQDTDAPLYAKLHVDRVARAAFLDHFFGSPVRLDAVAAGQHAEAGDFWGSDYKLEAAEIDPTGCCAVQMTREGEVLDGGHKRLIRVLKRFVIPPIEAGLTARYEVINRYVEPVSGLFAVEMTFNVGALDLEGSVLQIGEGARHRLNVVAEEQGVRNLALLDRRHGAVVRLFSSAPARLWHYPVVCVSRQGEQFREAIQGVCVVLGWELKLWGLESFRVDLDLNVDTDTR